MGFIATDLGKTKTSGTSTKATYYVNKKLPDGVLLGFGLDATFEDGRRVLKGATLQWADYLIETAKSQGWPDDVMHKIQFPDEDGNLETWYYYHKTKDKEASAETKAKWTFKVIA